jgi:hypothetical protein
MEDTGATKELTQAMMDTIANDVAESSNARVTSRQLFADPSWSFRMFQFDLPWSL